MIDENRAFKLFMPKQAVGANLVYFDLFNAAGSGVVLIVNSVMPVVSTAVSVVGTTGVDLNLTFTTSVGTGGTAAVVDGTSITAASITKMNPGDSSLSTLVTARLTPTGGATAGGIFGMGCVATDESQAGSYTGIQNELISGSPAIVPAGYGIRVVQNALASVGNIAFVVSFIVR